MDNKISDRNRHILGYVSNELSMVLPTLFDYMMVDEIRHMRILVEFRDVIQKDSAD